MTPAAKPAPFFVQVSTDPSLGVETTSGRAWVGVPRESGPGEAEFLYLLTEAQYVAALADPRSIDEFARECWRNEHEDLCLYTPPSPLARPTRFASARKRPLPPPWTGEIWHHADALHGPVGDGTEAIVSRALSGEPMIRHHRDGTSSATFRLTGEGAYPRSGALVGGLGPGATRDDAHRILGPPLDGGETYAIEGDRLRLEFIAGGLSELVVERPRRPAPPTPALQRLIDTLLTPDGGDAYKQFTAATGRLTRRRIASASRRLSFETGVEMHTRDAQVVAIRAPLQVTRFVADLFPHAQLPPSREAIEGVLGPPAYRAAGCDLYLYGDGDSELIVADADTPTAELWAVPRGMVPATDSWRGPSGEFTLFLDVVGLPVSHPLAQQVQLLPGVQVTPRRGAVAAVRVSLDGDGKDRRAAFLDVAPPGNSRAEIGLRHPRFSGERDDVYAFEDKWIHVHAPDGSRVTRITVQADYPHGLHGHARD